MGNAMPTGERLQIRKHWADRVKDLKFIDSLTNIKVEDEIFDDREITAKLVIDRVRQSKHDKEHGKKFNTENEIKQ